MTSLRLDSVVAAVRTGTVLHASAEEPAASLLNELAATLPEVFGSLESGCLQRIASALDPDGDSETFSEVLLLSASHVHVMHPLPERPEEVLLANAPAGRSVGLVLSQVHARAAELGGKT